MDIESSSNISMDKSKKNIKGRKKHYKKRDPLYYYYNIGGNTYKYTCKNKYYKHCLRFKCTNSKCMARGIYYQYLERFKPKEGDNYKHIKFESHSYTIPKIYKNKFDNDKFEEKDFILNGKPKKEEIFAYMKSFFFKRL